MSLEQIAIARRSVAPGDRLGRQILERRAARAWAHHFWVEALRADDKDRERCVTTPSCGTEAGYQWHRYHRDVEWPIPQSDPCGCKAAHRTYEKLRNQSKREAACAT